MAVNKIPAADLSNQLKANKLEAYQKAIEQDQQKSGEQQSFKASGLKWNIIKTKDNKKRVNPLMETDHVHISSIKKFDKSVKASSMISHKLGYKISLEDKKDVLIEKYIKNFLQAKSHNYIVAKFAQLKSSFLAQALTNIGVTIPELQKIQKKALAEAKEENELLYEENEYNAEMISIIGGPSKRIKKELQIMDEIRVQLTTQMEKLGHPELYTKQKLLEVKMAVCQRIREEFTKEKDLLTYQRDYFFINKDAVKAGPKKMFEI